MGLQCKDGSFIPIPLRQEDRTQPALHKQQRLEFLRAAAESANAPHNAGRGEEDMH